MVAAGLVWDTLGAGIPTAPHILSEGADHMRQTSIMAMFLLSRTTLLAVGVTLLLAGCAGRTTRPVTRPPSTTPAPRQAASPAASTHATRSSTAGTTATAESDAAPSGTAQDGQPTDSTGIPACDDYLASYKGCHRAAGIFAPGQLEDRYEAMRTSLLRDSRDPDIRPQLAARCNSLARQLRQALHGKACQPDPAQATSSP